MIRLDGTQIALVYARTHVAFVDQTARNVARLAVATGSPMPWISTKRSPGTQEVPL